MSKRASLISAKFDENKSFEGINESNNHNH